MLSAVPMRLFSWDFWLKGPTGEDVAEVKLSSWREKGSVRLSGAEYKIRRQGMLGPFLMETPDGRQAASATKKSIFRREFNISQGERRYVLRSVSAFGCEYGLFVESRRVGLIVRKSWFRRRAMVEINDEVPLWLQAFAVWLALLLWKRDSDATVSLLAAAGS